MNRSRNNQNGHTLLEMIIVLLLFSIILLIPLFTISPYNKGLTTGQFFEQLQQDILFAQQKAITYRVPVHVEFFPYGNAYRVVKQGSTFVEREAPDHIDIRQGSLHEAAVRYNMNGNVRYAGSVGFYSEEGRYRLVVLLGQGRFYIEKPDGTYVN